MTKTTVHNTAFASREVNSILDALCYYLSSVQVDSFVLQNSPQLKGR